MITNKIKIEVDEIEVDEMDKVIFKWLKQGYNYVYIDKKGYMIEDKFSIKNEFKSHITYIPSFSMIKDDKETVYSAMKKVKPNERSKVLSALRDEGIVVEASDPDDSDETTPKKLIDKLETSKDSLPEELKESCGHKMNQLAKLLSHSVHTDNVVKDVTTITTPLSESNVLEFYTTKTKMKKWVKGNPNASKSLNEGLSSELALLTECYFIYKRHMSKSKNTENAILETLDFLDKGKDSYPAKQTMYENQIFKWLNRLAKV
jgi:hypothetical protein